jgi:carbon storage regulator
MLALSRRVNEEIVIGDDIRIVVLAIKGPRVRLGIKAPPHVPVFRVELLSKFSRETAMPKKPRHLIESPAAKTGHFTARVEGRSSGHCASLR